MIQYFLNLGVQYTIKGMRFSPKVEMVHFYTTVGCVLLGYLRQHILEESHKFIHFIHPLPLRSITIYGKFFGGMVLREI